jgi:hypothetical protein
MKSNRTIFITLLAVIFIAGFAGCGGKQKETTLKDRTMSQVSDDYDPLTAVLGENPELDTAHVEEDEQTEQMAAAEAPMAEDEDYIGGTMGVFAPEVTINGEPVHATYTVKEATVQGTVVKENVKSGVETELPPGTYDITFKTKKVAGNQELTLRNVEIIQGRRLKRKVKFPVGKITLVTSGGRCVKKKIKIRKKGATDWIPGKFYTCKEIFLMAGEYEADQNGTPISGIQVYDGGTRNIVIHKK